MTLTPHILATHFFCFVLNSDSLPFVLGMPPPIHWSHQMSVKFYKITDSSHISQFTLVQATIITKELFNLFKSSLSHHDLCGLCSR